MTDQRPIYDVRSTSDIDQKAPNRKWKRRNSVAFMVIVSVVIWGAIFAVVL